MRKFFWCVLACAYIWFIIYGATDGHSDLDCALHKYVIGGNQCEASLKK